MLFLATRRLSILMDALRNALDDANRKIGATYQERRQFEEETRTKYNAAQTRLRADQLRPLSARKAQLEKRHP